MAADSDALLHDVLVFMQQLQTQPLAVETRTALRALVSRLQYADGASRPSYLDMSRRPTPRGAPDAIPVELDRDDVDSDANKWLWKASPATTDDGDASAECSDCFEDSSDDWPPKGAPSCPRPDLSPDWAVSAAAARSRALLCGPLWGSGTGPWRWAGWAGLARGLGLRRRCWAALVPAAAGPRLLLFAGPRSARPRRVLPLAAPATPCAGPCCAAYTARQGPQATALELCCPGRKTYQLWAADEKEAQDWVDALRRASQGEPQPTRSSPSEPTPAAPAASCNGALRGHSPNHRDGASDAIGSAVSVDSRSRSVSILGDGSVTPPPLDPPPSRASASPPRQAEEQYESMLPPGEEIYHDIAPPESTGPSYANVQQPPSPSRLGGGCTAASIQLDDLDEEDKQTRPLYDDVGASAGVTPRPCQQQPEYCNLQPSQDEDSLGEHLYDDIVSTETRASVYELIQDPGVGQSVCMTQGQSQSIQCS